MAGRRPGLVGAIIEVPIAVNIAAADWASAAAAEVVGAVGANGSSGA